MGCSTFHGAGHSRQLPCVVPLRSHERESSLGRHDWGPESSQKVEPAEEIDAQATNELRTDVFQSRPHRI
jgi:hypothetical protein